MLYNNIPTCSYLPDCVFSVIIEANHIYSYTRVVLILIVMKHYPTPDPYATENVSTENVAYCLSL